MTNFKSVRKFMEIFGQEIKEKASFPDDKITSLRYDLIKEELEELKEAIDLLSKRIESTVEIIMEHLKDTEQRLEDMEARIDAFSKDVD